MTTRNQEMAEKWTFYSPPIWDGKNLTWDVKNSAWDKKKARNFIAESYFPTPDWGSVGPVLNYKDKKKTGIENEENVTSEFPCFSQVKNISAECPINKALPCAIPFNIHKTKEYIKTSNYFPKKRLDELQKNSAYCNYTEDNSLWQYGFNGRLDALEIQGERFLVHPEYKKGREWIVISNVKSEKSKLVNSLSGESKANIHLGLGDTEDIVLSEGICQVTSNSVGNDGFALLRSKKDVSLVHLNGDIENGAVENTPRNSACWTVCSALSNEMPGLWSVVYEDGTVEVHPAEGPQIWGTQLLADSALGQLRWYGCEFGHHPMSLMIAGRTSLLLADLRTAGSRKDNLTSTQRNIFKTENMTSFIDPFEQICTFKKSDKNPYVYAVLNKTVLMFDMRHSKVPCMKWQHMMPSMSPTYASTINIDGNNECLILGSKEQQSVCLLPGTWGGANNEIRYSAVGLPHHVKMLRDSTELMRRQGVLFSSVAETRLRTNMTGMVPVKLNTEKEFFLITLNTPGDLVYQKFQYNSKEEFREETHTAIEAWRNWEKAVCSAGLSASPVINNNNNNDENNDEELDCWADVRNYFYETKVVEKNKEEDSDLFDDIFDDLPVNYDLNELFMESRYKALPPLVSRWNIKAALQDKQERLLKWDQRGTRSMGRPWQASMNKILIKNYKHGVEYTSDTLRRIKKKNGIEKKNKDIDNILRNLPQSVVRSLSVKKIHKYKDSLSSSVLARWENFKSSSEEQDQIRRCSASDDIAVMKTPKSKKLDKSRKDKFIVPNNSKGIPTLTKRAECKFTKKSDPKVEYLKEKCYKNRLYVSLLKIDDNRNLYNKCNVIDKAFLDSFKFSNTGNRNFKEVKEKECIRVKISKSQSFSESIDKNNNISLKKSLNVSENKSVRNESSMYCDKQNFEMSLKTKRPSSNSFKCINSKKKSKVDKDAINVINKRNSKQYPKNDDKGKKDSRSNSKFSKEKVLKNLTNRSREYKALSPKITNKNKNSVEYMKRKTRSTSQNKKESKSCKSNGKLTGNFKQEDLKQDVINNEMSAKRGTLKYLKQRDNFMKNKLVEFKDQDDLFASKSMTKQSFCESLLESDSPDDSFDYFSPDRKHKKRKASESSPITPRTERLADWTENGVKLFENVDGWCSSKNNDIKSDHKKIVMTVTYHMQQQNKGKKSSKRLSSMFPKSPSREESYNCSSLVYSPIHFPKSSETDCEDKGGDESQDEYFD